MKILLGDNQFFGVNHADLKKASATQKMFSSAKKITRFIDDSLEIGLDGFMINSNDLGYRVVQDYQFESKADKECHYSIPYPHKYAAMVNESGMLTLLSFVLKNIRLSDITNVLKFIFSSNAAFLLPIIVRLETPKNLPKGSVIYLQNVITDLLMGLKNGSRIIESYITAVERMGYKAGIITVNLRRFRENLEKFTGHNDIYVCFNINKTGFNVFPSVQKVENEIEYIKANTKWKLVGMSIFSSGSSRVTIQESIHFIKSQQLDYVVFGTSKLKNVKANLNLLKSENS